MLFDVSIDGKNYRLELRRAEEAWWCKLDGREFHADVVVAGKGVLSLLIDGVSYEVKRESAALGTHVWVGNARHTAELRDPKSLRNRGSAGSVESGPQRLVAPMSGKVVRILAPENTPVEAGQGVVVVEAMKMQNEIKSPKAGTVRKLMALEGASVNAGEVLAIVD